MIKSANKRASRFEEEVKSFLEDLSFSDVGGANDDFRIGGVRVDACAGHDDNTLIIVACTMSQDLKRKTLREKIKEFRETTSSIEKGIKKHELYKKYKSYKYILATKNIQTRKEDIDFANDANPRIYIIDDNCLKYYRDLHSKIKDYAKYNLLGELNVKPAIKSSFSIPAFLTKFGKNIKMYSFLANPRDLLEFSYVARRERKNERYYQRIIQKDKLNKITKHIDGGNILPNNIIVAFDEFLTKFVKFNEIYKDFKGACTALSGHSVSYGILEFPRSYRSCWIIDGQHRLYSFVKSKEVLGYNLPVVAFQNLDLEKQCRIFLDINKNQKPVPPDLVWDLNGDMIPSQEEGVISNVVKELNESKSLLHYKIYIPHKGIKKKQDFLNMAGICLSIKKSGLARQNTSSKIQNKLYDSNDYRKTISNLTKVLVEYFNIVEKLFPKDIAQGKKGFVLDNGGNSLMIRLLEKIVSYCTLSGKKKPGESDYLKYLKPARDSVDRISQDEGEGLVKLKKRLSSEGGRDDVLKEFIADIKSATGDFSFGGTEESSTSKRLRNLEGRLKDLICVVLTKEKGVDWFEKAVSKDIYGKARSRMKKYGEEDKNKAYLHIMLGECANIIRNNKSIFYPLFTKVDCGWGKDSEFEGALDLILRIRITKSAHSVGVDSKTHDEKLFNIHMDKMNSCLNQASCKGEVLNI